MTRATLLAMGMLPPPVTGQALMFDRAIAALKDHYDVSVIDTQFQKNVWEAGSLSVRKIAHFFTLLMAKIVPMLLTEKFDILYYCVAGPRKIGLIKDLIFLTLVRSRARKVVYHVHGAGGIALLLRGNVILRTWTRLVMCEPDLVLGPPPTLTNEAALFRANRELIVDNGIEDPLIERPAQKWPAARLSFAFIGMVTESKGVFELIEIARLLRDRGHRFTLYIVGEGRPDVVGRLQNLISRYDLEEAVHLTGVLVGEEKFRLLQQATIFLCPTFYEAETQPTVIMEALAVGVPAVAYDWRAINTIIAQGINGFTVPVHDIQAFCRAIESILADGEIDRMRSAARRIFLERFALDRHTNALILAFQSLQGDNRSGVATS